MTTAQPVTVAGKATGSTRPRNSHGLAVRRSPAAPGRPIDYATLSPGEMGDVAAEGGTTAGYEDGYADGQRDAQEASIAVERQHASRVEAAVSALCRAADAARDEYERRSAHLQSALPGFAFQLLEELVGRESILAVDPGRDAVARALALDDSSIAAVARLSPVDAAIVGDLADLSLSRELTVIADATVEAGGALVEVGTTTIDSQLSSALERVRAVIVGQTAPAES